MGTNYQGTAEEVGALDAYIKLMRCTTSVTGRILPRLQKAGLTVSQFGVLEAIFHLGPMCQKELGDKLLQSGGNITMVVNNLERQGLVVRLRDEIDKRYILVHLTWRGSEQVKELFPEHLEDVRGIFSVLNLEEIQVLNNLLRRLGKG